MNRRQFLLGSGAGAIALSAGGIALLEEQLWQPTKSIFLPPAGGWTDVSRGTYTWTLSTPLEVGDRLTMSPGGVLFGTRKLLEVVSVHVTDEIGFDERVWTQNQLSRMIKRPKRYVVSMESKA